MKRQALPIESPDQIRIAAAGGIHPVTVRNFLNGRPVRAMSRRRIEAAARELGFVLPKNTMAVPAKGSAIKTGGTADAADRP